MKTCEWLSSPDPRNRTNECSKAESKPLMSTFKKCLSKVKFYEPAILNTLTGQQRTLKKHVTSMGCTPEPVIQSCDTSQ